MSEIIHRRIRSFVRREGRLTSGQQRALDELLPRYGLDTDSGLFDLDEVFDRHQARILEIGFGNGTSLAQQASENPDTDFIGIEVHRPGVGHLLSELERLALSNVRVICADAVEVMQHCIPDLALDGIQIFFPDPWPKKRHHKRRLLQTEFVRLLARKLRSGATLHLATDWQNYAEQMVEVLSSISNLRNTATHGDFVPRPAFRPLTKFEQRGQRLGHGVWDLVFRKLT